MRRVETASMYLFTGISWVAFLARLGGWIEEAYLFARQRSSDWQARRAGGDRARESGRGEQDEIRNPRSGSHLAAGDADSEIAARRARKAGAPVREFSRFATTPVAKRPGSADRTWSARAAPIARHRAHS